MSARDDELAEAARRRREIERQPVPTVARERALRLIRAGLASAVLHPESDAVLDAEAGRLALDLGEEIRAGLRQEHEDDLERARLRSFTIGVRSALRIARERGSISDVEETNVATALAEQRAIPLDGLAEQLGEVTGRGEELVEIVRRFLA